MTIYDVDSVDQVMTSVEYRARMATCVTPSSAGDTGKETKLSEEMEMPDGKTEPAADPPVTEQEVLLMEAQDQSHDCKGQF